MRYGENPHQSGGVLRRPAHRAGSISTARQLQGKELSYNNIADTDAALECVKEFDDRPACVIVKHANPCGVAEADSLLAAYDRAFKTDPESAFGGIIAFNRDARRGDRRSHRRAAVRRGDHRARPSSPEAEAAIAGQEERPAAGHAGIGRPTRAAARLEEGHRRPARAGRRPRALREARRS